LRCKKSTKTRDYLSSDLQTVSAPFYDFFIATPFNHRLAGLVGCFEDHIRLQLD
jgi:hypothetical protein